jgi:hypothetical protein
MVISIPTVYSQIKESYKIIFAVVGIAVTIQLSSKIPIEFFESSIIASTAIVMFPLAVSISSFAVSRIYGGSKIFGKSYFILGLSYMLFFIGEAMFYFYMDPTGNYEHRIFAEMMFLVSTPLLITHIIINIRYFAEKLETYQKILLVVIPAVIVAGYGMSLLDTYSENTDGYFFNLLVIAESAASLGFIIVAFTVFRQTVLFVPWFLLLIGILFGTAGDLLYRYTDTITFYDFADPATGLWLASSMMVIYALYKHQKSI